MAGCNWGRITDVPWGVRFPGPKHAYAQHLSAGLIEPGTSLSLAVHPAQLYESLFGLLLLILCYRLLRRPHVPGNVFFTAVSIYAVFRFFIEFLRADSGGLSFGFLTFARIVSLVLLFGFQLATLCPRLVEIGKKEFKIA